MRRILILFLSLSLGLLPQEGFGTVQDSVSTEVREIKYDQSTNLHVPEFNKETLESLKTERAFDYSEKQQENWWLKFKSWLWELWLKFWNWLVGDYQANGFIAFLVHALPYLIIFGILAFVGWLFYKLNPGATLFRSKEKAELFFSEEEELIRSKDISELMEKALGNKDYRLAVRYYYLLILQRLTESEIIAYESDKTNSDYIAEISSEALKGAFRKVTNLYDHIWYGNFEVTEADFSKVKPSFSSLKDQIPKPVA